jgi:transcriptional regulator with XRE-family HTH domain
MAYSKASEKVSHQCDDHFSAGRYHRVMARNPKTRWFLRQWRKHRGYTQDQLAERAGLSKGYVSQLEIGTRQYTQELLETLALALRCSPADLIIRDPTQPESIWTLWDRLPEAQKPQAVAVIEALSKTGTNG